MTLYLTGIPSIDAVFQSVFTTGYMITLTGTPGSGIELLSKQFSVQGIGNQQVLYITTSEREVDVIETMKRFNWKSDIKIISIGNDYYETVLAKEIAVSKYREEGVQAPKIIEMAEGNASFEEYYSPNYITKVIYEIFKIKPPMRVVIDSLDFFLEEYDSKSVISLLRLIRSHALKNESEVLITLTSDMREKWIESAIEDISDGVIKLIKSVKDGQIIQDLIIWRIRNHPEKTAVFKYGFTENGISITSAERFTVR